jgi:hypothetical protein
VKSANPKPHQSWRQGRGHLVSLRDLAAKTKSLQIAGEPQPGCDRPVIKRFHAAFTASVDPPIGEPGEKRLRQPIVEKADAPFVVPLAVNAAFLALLSSQPHA